jgi:hypothetical protein
METNTNHPLIGKRVEITNGNHPWFGEIGTVREFKNTALGKAGFVVELENGTSCFVWSVSDLHKLRT